MTPRVSVLMAVYNGEKYLEEAIESILHQIFNDFEFIIVDDGSTDNSLQIARLFAQKDTRIRLIENSHNQGLSASLNNGLRAARGELIARMDADDVSLPHRLEQQVKFMNEHPEVDALGTAFTLIDQFGSQLRNVVFSNDFDILRWELLFSTPLAHPSVIIRSSILRKLGGYNPKFTSAQDYELWTRVILTGRLANLEEIHMSLRLHGERVTYKRRDQQKAFTSNAKQKYLQIVLHRDISGEAASDLGQKPTTARRAAIAAALILDYCNYCSKDIQASVAVQIMRSALEKAARKIGRFAVYPVTWWIGMRCCFLLLKLMITWLEAVGERFTGASRGFLSSEKPDIGRRVRHE